MVSPVRLLAVMHHNTGQHPVLSDPTVFCERRGREKQKNPCRQEKLLNHDISVAIRDGSLLLLRGRHEHVLIIPSRVNYRAGPECGESL